MNEYEAKAVAWAIGWADGGCNYCVGSICESLNEKLSHWQFELSDKEHAPDEPHEVEWVKVDVTCR